MSKLHSLTSIVAKQAKRVGRGYGSGKGGHTSTRGQKGQKSRTGAKIPLWFEGGQLPLIKRMPMLRGKGKLNSLRVVAEITLSDLNKLQAPVVSLDTLKLEKLIDARSHSAKIIASGKIEREVTVQGIKTSAQARKAIEQAGGKVE